MTKIGYARTSTVEQNLDSQIIALKAANCEIIRTEQKSGNNLEGRIELNNTGVSHLAFFQVQYIRFCHTYYGHIFGCQLMGL